MSTSSSSGHAVARDTLSKLNADLNSEDGRGHMAASLHNPYFGTQPYEESQGQPPPTSPNDLQAFYDEMQKKDLERKLSKRSSGPTSRWSRKKSVRKNAAAAESQEQTSRTRHNSAESKPAVANVQPGSNVENRRELDFIDEKREKSDFTAPNFPRSLVPDTLPALSAMPSEKEDWSSVTFRLKHPIHNPVGPRYYRNYHLLRPSARPSSYFSPSFPPMTYASQDSPRLPAVPSGSPLPTPEASQTTIAEGGKRSRKNSQTDPVDLLDVTDPSGTNWHHTSPYDLKYSTSSQDALKDRPRQPSLTAPQRGRFIPSPLSQSTSAVHLHPPEQVTNGTFKVMRKLSKRRTPIIGSLFNGPQNADNDKASVLSSLPTSPVGANVAGAQRSLTLPLRGASTSDLSTLNKGRRGSLLGRLVKKFSVLRRPASVRQSASWHHVQTHDLTPDPYPEPVRKPSSPVRLSAENRTTSAPVLSSKTQSESPSQFAVTEAAANSVRHEPDRSSHYSFEEPFSPGRLTIANPDAPSSAPSTPVAKDIPLPPEKPFSSYTPGPVRPEPVLSPPPEANVASPTLSSATTIRPPPPQLEQPSARTSSISQQPSFAPFRPLTVSDVPSEVSYAPHSMTSSMHVSPPTSQMNVEESPLSTASMIVNPPTPYVPEVPVPPTPGPPVPPKLPVAGPSSTQTNTPTSRQTETFRLVRTASGNVYQVSETIPGGGENWEVQKEPPRPPRSKAREQDKEAKDKKVSSRASRDKYLSVEPESERTRRNSGGNGRHRERRSDSAERERRPERERRTEDSTDYHSRHRKRTSSIEQQGRSSHRQSHSSHSVSPTKEGRSSRRKEEEHEKEKDTKVSNGQTANAHKPQSAPPTTAGPSTSSTPLERRPSASSRPISEGPSAADLNSMKAREAYDMERLWKGRSMHNNEHNGTTVVFPPFPVLTTTSPPPPPPSTHSHMREAATHGSSHTSYTLQSPFQSQPSSNQNHIYHSMPASPPPIIYAPASSIPQSYSNQPLSPASANSHERPNRSKTLNVFPTTVPDPLLPVPSSSRGPLSNPLPEPPRESSYRPAPINISPTDSGRARSIDQWTNHTGLTTAH